ncbi:MAG: hypothetical protein U1E14_03730 [Geminicoccaceae bacterium]
MAEAKPDACTTTVNSSTRTITCQGNQSAGIADGIDFPTSAPQPYTQLDVNKLQVTIEPASGVAGIRLTGQMAAGATGYSRLNASLGFSADGIRTTGAGAHGIMVVQQGANGSSGGFGTTSAGGAGRPGGTGDVSVTSIAGIETSGTAAHGILLQATGGNGGGGGDSACCNGGDGADGASALVFGEGAGPVTVKGNQSSGINASGRAGNGGNGGNISTAGNGGSGGDGGEGSIQLGANNSWTIATRGATSSPGIHGEFIAGNGGGGGLGYKGGRGGDGGSVQDFDLVLPGAHTITTAGSASPGIDLSARGGNGGSGGESLANSGGTAGDGGFGGIFKLLRENSAAVDITTTGDGSAGFSVLATGGNGGNGGDSVCCNGGQAGNGGGGGSVVIGTPSSSVTATITTTGDQAHGLLVVSQGGNGGNGGGSDSFGGAKNGGGGGGGGWITVLNRYAITTQGAQSHGMAVLSLGGTGGKGSDGSFFNPKSGGGGSTGPSGDLTVNLYSGASIRTGGPESHGILLQSIAGHAGDAGSSASLVSFAATGGSAGDGGKVTSLNYAAITTTADQSMGIVAQSIGGGGGSGGSGFGLFYGQGGGGSIGGAGGVVALTNYGQISTAGDDASGILAQSIGGTGGDGGTDTSSIVALGGGGANSSNGGSVSVTNAGSIVTGATSGGNVPAGDDPTCGSGCSHGILAQSIGGGGGNGGFAVGVSLGDEGNLGVAIGGGGGAGGSGGEVDVTTTGGKVALETAGTASYGMLAQSIGGGGGNGGFAIDLAGGLSGGSLAFALGGSGGVGGTGGLVDVASGGSIATGGFGSHALVAQSIGGGGGNGGFTIAAAGNLDGAAVALALGGKGNAGGNAAAVTVTSSTAVSTSGAQAHGLLAQSLGGGGGSGGLALSATAAQGNTIDASLALGGNGGRGGDGGAVSVTNAGSIQTSGDGSRAIMAQSIGGGGGSGGMSVAPAYWSAQTKVQVALGGKGGGGGSGGNVTVVNHGALVTGTTPGGDAATIEGRSHAIFAQSVGGGGGSGGIATLKVSTPIGDEPGTDDAPGAGAGEDKVSISLGAGIGGGGGSAGAGGIVDVTNTGTLLTRTDASAGIFAQSIGGGGGDGGVNASSAKLFGQEPGSAGGTSYSASIVVGGVGGEGNAGVPVSIANSGTIQTWGDGSYGMVGQSIGGGGGDGGTNTLGSTSLTADAAPGGASIDASVVLGGSGGSGNRGGNVDIASSAQIQTVGSGSHAIFAQSVGGGGGSGGAIKTPGVSAKDDEIQLRLGLGGNGGSGGSGATVSVDSSGVIGTTGAGALGILAQSVGGGGGDAGGSEAGDADSRSAFNSIVVEVGGKGGASGNGGPVTVVHEDGTVATRGDGAVAIMAQSVGGGGGRGGTATVGLTGTVAVGGGGGAAGNGGTVTVSVTGATILTGGPGSGTAAYGILAQSVGGGGGVGGNANLGAASAGGIGWSNFGAGLPISLPGGSSGDGGAVNVTVAADIATHAGSAVGILAQSVGGGGGIAGAIGTSPVVGHVGSGGGSGAGGAVSVNMAGTITTSGEAAHGILAQSAGGTTAGGSSGKGGAVTVEVAATVLAEGRDANAIMAQSVGKGGNGRVQVTVRDGSTIVGGSGQGAAILVLDGTDNLVSLGGSVASGEGIDGRAVVATTGNDFVVVNGTLSGNIDLGAGGNTLNINGSGRLYSGSTVALGGGNRLTVFGLLSPGGDAVLKTTAVSGSLVQSGGTYLVTLDGKTVNLNDRVDVSGSADMTGTVEVRVVDVGTGTVRSRTTIVDAQGGVTPATAQHLTVKPSAVGHFGLAFDNPKKVDLTYGIDFLDGRLRAGLNDNQEAVAEALEGLHAAGAVHRDLLYLLQAEDVGAYGNALDGLSPEPYAVSAWAAVLSAEQFNDSMMSCRERAGDFRFVAEGQCVRIGFEGRRFTRDESSGDVGYTLDATGISIGAQKELAPGWHAGLGAAYESWSADADGNLWRSSASQFEGGLVLKREFGATLLAASVSGGFADVDVTRNITPGLQADGEQDTWFAGGQIRVAHAFVFGSWYLKPRNDLSITWVHSDDVDESGAGAASLDVEDESKTFVALQPALEVGGEVALADGYVARPRISIGVTHFLDDPSPTARASFRDAPSGAPVIDVTSDVDRTTLDLELGVDVIASGGVVVGLGGFAQRGSDTTNLGGGLRLSMAF